MKQSSFQKFCQNHWTLQYSGGREGSTVQCSGGHEGSTLGTGGKYNGRHELVQ
jgi:hypothetical protein